MTRPSVRWVQDPEEWRVLLAPARLEIIQALRCVGPCSVAELATMVGRPADLLYRQLVKLEKAGFVVQPGTRKRGRHAERLYDVTAQDFAMAFRDLSTESSARGLSETARSFCNAAAKEVQTSSKTGNLILGEGQNFILNYEMSWLAPAQFQAARALLYQVKQLLDQARTQRAGRPFVCVTVLTPVTRRARRAGAKTGGSKTTDTKQAPKPDTPPSA